MKKLSKKKKLTISEIIKMAYNEGWNDYHIYQNKQRGTPKHFQQCLNDSEANTNIKKFVSIGF